MCIFATSKEIDMQNHSSKPRIIWIDWAKSICMLLVIMGHCHIQEEDRVFTQLIYSFHIQMFFFLSGVLCKRTFSLSSLKSDVKYLIIPYLTFGVLTIFCDLVRAKSIQIETLICQFQELFTGYHTYIGPYWFLLSLFICKQIFLIVSKVKHSNTLLYYIIAALSFVPAYYISYFNFNLPFFADSALLGLPFFILGNESLRLIEKIERQDWRLRLMAAVTLCLLSYYLSLTNGFVSMAHCMIGHSIILYYSNSITAICAVILICTIAGRIKSTFVTITAYGTIATLGCHSLFLTILYYYLPKLLAIANMSYSWFTGILFSMITYIGCYFLIIYFDRFIPKPFGLKGNLTAIIDPRKLRHYPFIS